MLKHKSGPSISFFLHGIYRLTVTFRIKWNFTGWHLEGISWPASASSLLHFQDAFICCLRISRNKWRALVMPGRYSMLPAWLIQLFRGSFSRTHCSSTSATSTLGLIAMKCILLWQWISHSIVLMDVLVFSPLRRAPWVRGWLINSASSDLDPVLGHRLVF